MGLNQLPLEVLSLVLHYLHPGEREHKDSEYDLNDLCAARLVCRRWNVVATGHLFHTVRLTHEWSLRMEDEEKFGGWNSLVSFEAVRQSARRVIIHSTPDNLEYGRDFDVWSQWEQGIYPAFTNAIDRISELPGLNAVCIRFSEDCLGSDQFASFDDDQLELISTRKHTLEAVFRAIKQRMMNNPDNMKISSLTLDNLQNVPLREFTSSDLFRDVTNHISKLHLLATQQYNKEEIGSYPDFADLRQFPEFLRHSWLAPLAGQLTSLTLHDVEPWGALPHYYNFDGLNFPNLRSLVLGLFAIAHRDQMNWVLAQTSLTSLLFDDCTIISHIAVKNSYQDKWGLRTRDWQPLDALDYGFGDEFLVYHYPGTWEDEFDRIRTSLFKLVDFRFHYGVRQQYLRFTTTIESDDELLTRRYVVSTQGFEHTETGYKRHGGLEDQGPDPGTQTLSESTREVKKVNRANETAEGDLRAFKELRTTVNERSRTSGVS